MAFPGVIVFVTGVEVAEFDAYGAAVAYRSTALAVGSATADAVVPPD
jgi:hypothetical protein